MYLKYISLKINIFKYFNIYFLLFDIYLESKYKLKNKKSNINVKRQKALLLPLIIFLERSIQFKPLLEVFVVLSGFVNGIKF